MSSVLGAMSSAARKILGDELYLFLAYVFIVFRPGAEPPSHPHASTAPPTPVPARWRPEEYQLYIDEARLDMQGQQADKRDIRARAQILLTTAIIVGGAIAASFSDKRHVCLCGALLYGAAALSTTVAGLAAGGIISAKSQIGAPNLLALPLIGSGDLFRRVANEYAYTRTVGQETVAVLVTVLRDCVLALIIGALLLAIAHTAV